MDQLQFQNVECRKENVDGTSGSSAESESDQMEFDDFYLVNTI